LRTAIGRVLRRIRLAQGRTLRDVADAAGVSLPYLSEVERGRKEASSEVLAGICRALGLELPDLLSEVRTELLRGLPVRSPWMRVTCGSAVSGSAVGRARVRIGPRSPRLAACRTTSPFWAPRSTTTC
jgi:DNA-binding Xre family transcriptional regulator